MAITEQELAQAEARMEAIRAAGHAVAIVEGDPMLEKITHPADFAAAEARHAATLTGADLNSAFAALLRSGSTRALSPFRA